MIVLCTDFGLEGPYTGQVKAVLQQQVPDVPVIDLFSDLPVHNPKAAAYLLPAYCKGFEPGTVFLCVVDPGVGGERDALIVHADQHWFVGPDNGLFEIINRRASDSKCWRINWRPQQLSNSFHGRDLFAPVAAMLVKGQMPAAQRIKAPTYQPGYPDDLFEIVYIDHYGNAMIGIRAGTLPDSVVLSVNGHELTNANTFSDMQPGEAFWYVNSNDLVEIAVNSGRSVDVLGVKIGDACSIV